MAPSFLLAVFAGRAFSESCDSSGSCSEEATLLQGGFRQRNVHKHATKNDGLVTLEWADGSVTVTEETICVSGSTQITGTFGVTNDRLTGISGLRAGCEVKLFEHSRHCRDTEDAEDNCDDQICLTFTSDTNDMGTLTNKVSGATITCPSSGKLQGCPGSSLDWDDSTEGADVRCCTLDGSESSYGDNCNSGYLPQNYDFSDGASAGRNCAAGDCRDDDNAWCHEGVTFDQAQQICASNGERLCTRAEIEARDCCGTGCRHNHHMIWFSDVGSTSTGTTSDGCLTSNYEEGENPTTAQTDPAAEGAVRCCGDDGGCTTQNLYGSVTDQIYGIDGSPVTTQACHTSVTYDAARGICAEAGLRLCTVAELNDGRCCGTGCWNDHRPTWATP